MILLVVNEGSDNEKHLTSETASSSSLGTAAVIGDHYCWHMYVTKVSNVG